MCKYEFTSNESEPGLETVMNELRKNQKGISNLKYLKPPDEGILQFLSYSSLHKSKVDFYEKIDLWTKFRKSNSKTVGCPHLGALNISDY